MMYDDMMETSRGSIPVDPDDQNIVLEQTPQEKAKEEKKAKLFDFARIKTRLTQLNSSFAAGPKTQADINRKLRFFDVDPQALRDSKEIGEDETIVNIRTINTNIEREQPSFINFLRNSRRLVTFSRKEGKNKVDTELLEDDFTRGMTYSGWEIPLYQELDGSELHGWDAIEVVFDDSKPLHVAHDHIGNDKLIFPRGSLNIQSHEIIMRQFDDTPNELLDLVDDFGFNADQIQKVVAAVIDTQRQDETLSIYKVFIKFDKVVYVAWADLNVADDWLLAPRVHYVGWDEQVEEMQEQEPVMGMPTMHPMTGEMMPGELQQQPPILVKVWKRKPLTEFPIFLLRYKLTEQKTIQETNGRAFLDQPKQEALTALWSAFVNGGTRASNVNASPKNQSGTGQAPKQLEQTIGSGVMWSEPIEFSHPPYPDESLIRAAQNLDTQNSQEVGQLTFAVQNRKGSRTTAKEITAAEASNQLLNSVQLTLFSTHIRDVFTFDWKIVQSRALQGLVPLLAVIEKQIPNADGSTSIVYENDMETIAKDYEIRAAGDVDVIQRAEQLEKYGSFWPVVEMTSIAPMYLADMLRVAFPVQGDKYAAAIQQVQKDKELVAKLAQALAGFVQASPQIVAGLPPEAKQSMEQLMQEVAVSQQQIV